MQTIICELCGESRETKYKNTKRCQECSYYKNLIYPHKIRKCVCGTRFQPVARGDQLCGEHLYESETLIECAFCKKTDQSCFGEVRVCSKCARDPLHRKALIKAFEKRLIERRDKNDGELNIGTV